MFDPRCLLLDIGLFRLSFVAPELFRTRWWTGSCTLLLRCVLGVTRFWRLHDVFHRLVTILAIGTIHNGFLGI